MSSYLEPPCQPWRSYSTGIETKTKQSAYRFRAVSGLYTATIEEKPDRSGSLALSFAKGIHQLFEGRGTLDFEEDFVVVVGNLDVEMLTLATSLSLFGGAWASVVV